MQIVRQLLVIFMAFASVLSAASNRVYDTEVSSAEKKDIAYIVKTLGNASLTSIWKNKPSLEKAGERIDPVHPLNFLKTTFENEELKVGLHNIKARGSWVAKEFFSGIHASMDHESSRENMSHEQIADFSAKLGIDPQLLYSAADRKQWGEFIDILIHHLPRTGNPDRYNI